MFRDVYSFGFVCHFYFYFYFWLSYLVFFVVEAVVRKLSLLLIIIYYTILPITLQITLLEYHYPKFPSSSATASTPTTSGPIPSTMPHIPLQHGISLIIIPHERIDTPHRDIQLQFLDKILLQFIGGDNLHIRYCLYGALWLFFLFFPVIFVKG